MSESKTIILGVNAGMFLYKMLILCDVHNTGLLYGPGPVQGPGRRMSKYRSVAGSSTSGQNVAVPSLYITWRRLGNTEPWSRVSSLVLSSRRNLDHCIVVFRCRVLVLV